MIYLLDGLNKIGKIDWLNKNKKIQKDDFVVYNHVESFMSQQKEKSFIYGEYFSILKFLSLWENNNTSKDLIVKHFPLSEFVYATMENDSGDLQNFNNLFDILDEIYDDTNGQIKLYLFLLDVEKSDIKNYIKCFQHSFLMSPRWQSINVESELHLKDVLLYLNDLFRKIANHCDFKGLEIIDVNWQKH